MIYVHSIYCHILKVYLDVLRYDDIISSFTIIGSTELFINDYNNSQFSSSPQMQYKCLDIDNEESPDYIIEGK